MQYIARRNGNVRCHVGHPIGGDNSMGKIVRDVMGGDGMEQKMWETL